MSAFAVDPVSAATMANAFAQAITSYGATHGVSLTFDVASADGIGVAMHDLWENAKADLDSAAGSTVIPYYNDISVALWNTIYKRIGSKIGISLSDTVVGYLDAFYNWLLSGPAEMVKVDNHYYEWVLNQSGSVDPVTVISSFSFPAAPVTGTTYQSIRAGGFWPYINSSGNTVFYGSNSPDAYFAFVHVDGGPYYGYFLTKSSGVSVYRNIPPNASVLSYQVSGTDPSAPSVYYYGLGSLSSISPNPQMPEFPSFVLMMQSFESASSSSIAVQPYVGDAVPQDVYIPDNNDVNYAPAPYEQALDYNWDSTAYGDGTGAMTDAQSQAVTDTIDSAITQSESKTITKYVSTPAPAPNPSEVVIPFLPIELPSFNFSLSGIWYYVVAWVQSLGSWLSMMFTVWGSLPYALVVPVYASAVIVIVLGVYKRFFM